MTYRNQQFYQHQAVQFYDADLENGDETNRLLPQRQKEVTTVERMREEACNPFKQESQAQKSDHDALLKNMRRVSAGQKRGCFSEVSLFFRIYTEQFNASMLLLPALFYTIGFTSATLQLVIFSAAAAFSAKLMVESSRLQVGNYHVVNKEDFESLVCSNRYILNSVVSATQNAFPILLIIGSAVSIVVVSALADEIINMAMDLKGDSAGEGQYFVNMLRASDSKMNPIPDSELIQISRGYALVLVLSLLYSAVIGPKQPYAGQFFKFLAIIGLFIGVAVDLVQANWESFASREFQLQLAESRQKTFIHTLFYSGFLIFSVGNLPITIPEISGEYKTSELPIYKATTCAVLTKVLFGVIGSHLILNASAGEIQQYALIGSGVFAVFFLIPDIIGTQQKMYMVLYCRGTFTGSVSVLIAAMVPWTVSSVVHSYDTVFSIICLLGSTLTMYTHNINSYWLYSSTMDEACKFESNFQLSVKQMYAGDKLSKKETSRIPKTNKEYASSCHESIAQSDERQTQVSINVSSAPNLTLHSQFNQKSQATVGTMKCRQYPTTQFLRASEMTKHYSGCSSGPESEGQRFSDFNCDSDFSEAFSIVSDEEVDAPLDSEIFIKTYNQQGHYATKQSLENLLGPFAATYLKQGHAITIFQIVGSLAIRNKEY